MTKHKAHAASIDCPPGLREDFERWQPVAATLPDADITPLRVEVGIARANLLTGVLAVLPHRDRLATLTEPSLVAIEELPGLGSALSFAQMVVDTYTPGPSAIRARIAEATSLRKLLLGGADLLVTAGLFDADKVKKIRAGRGAIDTATDCVALTELYRAHGESWVGKVPFGTDELARAAHVGSVLLHVLRPTDAPSLPPSPEVAAATKIRNQLWTLLDRGWERELWRAGAWLFGRAVDDHVPPLASRAVAKREAPIEPPAAA